MAYKQKKEQNNYWRGGKSAYTCLQCGGGFLAYASERKRGGAKFCSTECGYENKRRRSTAECKQCGKSFSRPTYQLERVKTYNFCSKKCTRTYFSGKNTYNWKGGVCHGIAALRGGVEYRKWRTGVVVRDDYTCVKCGETGNQAHHILSFTEYPEERYALDNGVTWCKRCHFDWHAMVRSRNSRGQYVS